MLRLCSDSSRSYPGRSAPHAFRKKSAATGNGCRDGAEVSRSHSRQDSTTHGGVVAGNKPT